MGETMLVNGRNRKPLVKYKGKHLEFYIDSKTNWEYVHRPNSTEGVSIVPLTANGKIVLAEQYRVPIGAFVIELPAGLVGDAGKESVEEAVRKELRQEVDCECDEVERICKGSMSPGLSDELNWLCIAHRARPINDSLSNNDPRAIVSDNIVRGEEKEGEAIRRHIVPVSIADDWLKEQVRDGIVVDLKVFAGLYFAQRRAH